jgi:hypothetical protein
MTDWTTGGIPDESEDDLWVGFPAVDGGPRLNPHPPGTEHHAEWGRQEAAEATTRAELRAAERDLRRRQRQQADINRELERMRARHAATALFAAERAQDTSVPDGITLTDFLRQPFEPTRFRIDGLWPRRGNVILAAQYKAGKTTLRDNLVRALVDGGRFLGIYPVEQVTDGRVGVIDFEMPGNKLQEWLRDQAIRNTDNVTMWSLRGYARTFDLFTDQVRAQWVEKIKAAQIRVLAVDCLGPILSAFGLNENEQKDVGPFLDGLTALAAEAGVDECLLIHHMGHGSERSRGASRLRDWPDAEWRLVRQQNEENPLGDPDPAAPRFFAAFGRDVDVREGQVVFDKASRRLVYAEGNRRQARASNALMFVLEQVREKPAASVRGVQDSPVRPDGVSRDAVRDAIKHAVSEGFLKEAPGPNRSKLHTITATGLAHLAGPVMPDDDLTDPWRPVVACRSCFGPVDADEAVEMGVDRCRRCREKESAA